MSKVKVENVVASIWIGTTMDLEMIDSKVDEVKYDRKRFPGLIYKLEAPKAVILIFRNGKAVCTGAKSIEDIYTAIDMVTKRFKGIGVPIENEPEIKIVNIVASYDLESDLNLNAVAVGLGMENVEYEPEQFPGLVYRIKEPKAVVLLFGSGKVICTGARRLEDVERAIENIKKELFEADLLR